MTTQLDLLKRAWIENSVPFIAGQNPGHTFTSDHLHGLLDAPAHQNWWGVLMAVCKKRGLVERVGYQTSQRREANGRSIVIWKVKSTATNQD